MKRNIIAYTLTLFVLLPVVLAVSCQQQPGPVPTTPEATPIPSTTPTPTPIIPTPKQIEASDSQITIVLDKLERADAMPSDIAETLSAGPLPRKVPTPTEGCDFVCIYLTIARIENVHMVDPLGYGDEGPVLLDAQSNEYEPISAQVRGIRLLDPTDIKGPCEAVEGATGFLVFEVPKHEKPSKLKFVYSFKETWEEEFEKRGQIDIILEEENGRV